jgi:hypothetical protein
LTDSFQEYTTVWFPEAQNQIPKTQTRKRKHYSLCAVETILTKPLKTFSLQFQTLKPNQKLSQNKSNCETNTPRICGLEFRFG